MDIRPEILRFTHQSLSTIHHALRAPRRRLVVGLVSHRVLTTATTGSNPTGSVGGVTDSPVKIPVRQLSKEIAAIEEGIRIEHATGDPYQNVYNSLTQTHLPELDDVGAIDYDSDRKTVVADQNLIALSMAATVTSPIAQMLFHAAVADFYSGGSSSRQDSMGH